MNNRIGYYRFSVGTMLFLIVALILFNSCEESKRSKIYPLVNNIKSYCPIPTSFGSMDNIELYEDTIVFSFSVSDKNFNYGIYSQHPVQAKELTLMELCVVKNDKYWRQIINAIKDNEVYIKEIFSSKEGDVSCSVLLSSTDIKMAFAKYQEFSPYKLMVMSDVTKANLYLPTHIDEATTLVEGKIENDKVIYVYEIDESKVSVDMLKSVLPEIKKMTLEQYKYKLDKDETQQFKKFLRNCLNCNLPLVHRYIGSQSGQNAEIIIDCHEYESLIKLLHEKYKL